MTTSSTGLGKFIRHHFRHFNARALVDAADGYRTHLDAGGRMLVTLAGAMSTAELGLSLAEMIRQGKVHGICSTGANLEEDVFNLVAHDHYRRIANYRDLTPQDERALLENHMNRVTDTCIPEAEAMRRIEGAILRYWMAADKAGERRFPSEFFFCVLRDAEVQASFQIDVRDSWLYAAMEAKIPVFVPGWEDSTLGNMYAGHCMQGDVKNVHTVRTGIETMVWLAEWYTTHLGRVAHRLLSDWRRHRRGLPDLRRSHAAAGFAAKGYAALGLLLSDQRFNHKLRLILRGGPQREDHLGEVGRRYAEVHHRVGRNHRRPADFCRHPWVVRIKEKGLSWPASAEPFRRAERPSRKAQPGGSCHACGKDGRCRFRCD